MKFRTLRKKAAAGFLAAALIVGSVSAITFDDNVYSTYAPTSATTTVDSSILSGATAAANTPVLSMLGVNVTSTDAAGVYNSAGYNGRTTPINLLVFGSSLNETADPYLSGFYYNLANTSTGGNTYSASDYASWTGLYTLINSAKSGPTGAANNTNTIDIDVSETTVNCNPVFYYEPDVLLGSSTSSYDTGLSYYQSTINSRYTPLQVGGWSTSEYCLNDGTIASTVAMANGVWKDAAILDAYATSINKVGRYNSSATIRQCGETYANFALGLYFCVQDMLEDGDLTTVTYCTALTVDDDGNYVVGTGSGRMAQYADGLGTQVTSGTYSSAEELKKAVDVVIASNLTDDQIEDLEDAEIKVITSLPDAVYGTTMQSPDNILGVPYYIAVFYGDDSDIGLTEADVTAYFVDNIYHIDGTSNVETVVEVMMGEDVTISSDYNSVIASLIEQGKTYYTSDYDGDDIEWLAVDNANVTYTCSYDEDTGAYSVTGNNKSTLY